jgi:putative signal transducing protein
MDSRVIFQTWSDTEAALVRGILESHGIPCSINSEIPHSVVPLTVDGLGEIRLSVPLEAVDEARQILQEHLEAGTAGNLGVDTD